MKQLLNLLEESLCDTEPLHTLILLGAGRVSDHAMQVNRLANRVIIIDSEVVNCEANQQLLSRYKNWQVIPATIAPQAGPTTYYTFNSRRFNGLFSIEQLDKRPANLKQTGAHSVDAITLNELLCGLNINGSEKDYALLIDVGDLSMPVLGSTKKEHLALLRYVGVRLQNIQAPWFIKQRVDVARNLALQMLFMRRDDSGQDACFIYECDTSIDQNAYQNAKSEKAESESQLPEIKELRQLLETNSDQYQALLREMEQMKIIQGQRFDEAEHEKQLLLSEVNDLTSKHLKFNELLLRAESQLDLIKTLLFREQGI